MRSRKQKRSDVVAEDIEGVDKADSKPLATIEEQPEVETKKPAGREEDSDAEDFSQKGKKKKPQEKQVKATESKDEEEQEGDGAFKMKTAAQKKAEARDPRRKDKRPKTNLRAEKQEDKGKEVIAEPEAAVAEEEHEEEQDERAEGAEPTGQMEEPRKRRREGEEEAAEENKDKKDKRGKRKTKNNRRRARDEALGKLAQHSVVSSQDSVTKKPVYGDRKKKRTATHTAPQPVTVKTPEFDKTEPLPKECLPSETDTKTPAPLSLTLDMPCTSLGDAPLNTTPTLPPASRECTPTLLSTPKLGARDQHRTSTTDHNDSPVAKPDVIAQESDTPMPFTQEKPTVNNYQEKEKQRQPLNQDISASMNKPEGQREEPRMIISLNDNVELNKSEKAWKLPCKTPRAEEVEENNPDEATTQDLFKRVRGILNKLTPERFQSLMEQVTELQMIIDTEERLEGVIDLIFEKAISESKYSETYAKMCLSNSKFKVPTADKPGESVTFRHLLLNRCQKEFEKDKDDEEIFEKKQKELDAVPGEEKHRLKEELEEFKDKAKRRSLGNIKFIGELFKLKMLTEGIVHDCIIKLLKNHDEKSLECLCRLFEATGKDLDSEKAKGRMDMYFKQMENIQKESKAMIRCKLQDVLDLRENNWVPRRRIQGPKTIVQIHEDVKREEQAKKIPKAPFGGGFNNTRLGPGAKTPAPSSLTPDMLPSLGDVPLKTTPTLPPSTAVNTNVKPPPATRDYTPTLPSTPKFPDNTAATLPDPVSHLWVSEVDGTSTNEHNDSPNTKPDVVAQERDVPTTMPPTQEKPVVNISASTNKPEGLREEPRKITPNISLTDDAQLSKSEKAWKPSRKKPSREDVEENDPDEAKTQDLFKRVRGVLNKLTPERFQSLMNQMTELQRTIDTEERLKGVIDLIFEKAISESKYSEIYAKMCLCHSKFKVPNADKPGDSVMFQHLLLNRCQMEFEKDKDDEVIFEKKQKELDAVPGEEKHRLKEELEESKDKAKRRSLGNIKFIGELFKLKMLTEGIVYDCIVKLLKNHDEKSLACLCRLFETTGEGLDTEKAKEPMDMYFKEMETIKKESKICSMIRCNLQDVLDLRGNNWVPRRGIQGPKTIKQIHAEAAMEEHREEMKHNSNKELIGNAVGRTSSHAQSRLNVPQDKGWNPSVPISTKSVPFDTSRLCKITKAPVPDFDNLWLGPGGKSMSAFTTCWAKGCSGWTSISGSVG